MHLSQLGHEATADTSANIVTITGVQMPNGRDLLCATGAML